MTTIQVIDLKRNDPLGYTELTYKMWFTLPSIYGTGAVPVSGLKAIVNSYPDGYGTEIVSGVTVITYSQTIADGIATATLAQIKTKLIAKYNQIRTLLDALTLKPFDAIANLTYDGTTWS